MIEVIFRLAHFFGVEAIIPWRDGNVVRIGDCLHIRDFFAHARHCGGPNLHHQVHRLIRVLRHGIGHPVMRMGGKTQNFGALLTQFQDFGDGRVRVIGILIIAALGESTPDFFAQITTSRVFEEWLYR